MMPIDMRPVHLWMGLTHPIFGPANLALYTIYSGMAWQMAWLNLIAESAHFGEKPRNPPG